MRPFEGAEEFGSASGNGVGVGASSFLSSFFLPADLSSFSTLRPASPHLRPSPPFSPQNSPYSFATRRRLARGRPFPRRAVRPFPFPTLLRPTDLSSSVDAPRRFDKSAAVIASGSFDGPFILALKQQTDRKEEAVEKSFKRRLVSELTIYLGGRKRCWWCGRETSMAKGSGREVSRAPLPPSSALSLLQVLLVPSSRTNSFFLLFLFPSFLRLADPPVRNGRRLRSVPSKSLRRGGRRGRHGGRGAE